jgi:hypothetical protein
MGASGAILTTSRRYHNFSRDLQRKGETIRPFDPAQSWDLLLQLLGDDWKKMDREGRIQACLKSLEDWPLPFVKQRIW